MIPEDRMFGMSRRLLSGEAFLRLCNSLYVEVIRCAVYLIRNLYIMQCQESRTDVSGRVVGTIELYLKS